MVAQHRAAIQQRLDEVTWHIHRNLIDIVLHDHVGARFITVHYTIPGLRKDTMQELWRVYTTAGWLVTIDDDGLTITNYEDNSMPVDERLWSYKTKTNRVETSEYKDLLLFGNYIMVDLHQLMLPIEQFTL